MDIRLLGPVEVVRDGRGDDLGSPRRRLLLAMLALEPGRAVSLSAVVDRLWGDEPPARVTSSVYGHVSRLRGALGEGTVRRTAAGYVLDVDPALVDVHRFSALAGGGELRAALDLWRGPALAGLPGRWAEDARVGLQERRLGVFVRWAETADDPAAVAAEARALLREHPYAEALEAVLLRALLAAGRWPEALASYDVFRRELADHLGVDPGAELRALHRDLLRMDTGPEPPAGKRPAELPADIPAFTGRDRELSVLDEMVDRAGQGDTAVAVVCGTAGVGKTALAVRWAWRARDRFPDGQLYVDLRGYGPDRALEPADVLGRFLRSLGVRPSAVPDAEDERAALFRSTMDGRRMLLLLDNAGGVAQVRPLLPGSGSCFTVLTSRDALAGAVVREGARRVDVPPLRTEEALQLLGSLVDGPRPGAEPDAARALVEQSCGLPLALRLVAELAVARPATALADLAAELADEQRRLDRLDAGDDPQSALRAVFSWSVEHLGAPAARAYRLLGLHPGAEFGTAAAAALIGEDPVALLDQLVRAHLVERDGDRFRMHDLLRAYAVALVGDKERGPAVDRVLESYVDGSIAAADLLFPADRGRRPRASGTRRWEAPADAAAALAWFDRERTNLVEAAALAAREDAARWTEAFSRTLWCYLYTCNHYSDAVQVHEHARDTGRRTGDRGAEATGLHHLGTVRWRVGRFDEALAAMEEARELRRALGDEPGELSTLSNIGIVLMDMGRLTEALELYEPMLVCQREAGDHAGEVKTLGQLGTIYQRLGRLDEGLRCCEEVLERVRHLGDRPREANALNNLAMAYRRHGRYAAGVRSAEAGLRICVEIEDRGGQAVALAILGTLLHGLGRSDKAVEHCRRSVDLLAKIDDRARESEVLNVLGGILADAGRLEEAGAERRRALALAEASGSSDEAAGAHAGLAEVAVRQGRPEEAVEHWKAALVRYEEMGVPEADAVRQRLSALDAE